MIGSNALPGLTVPVSGDWSAEFFTTARAALVARGLILRKFQKERLMTKASVESRFRVEGMDCAYTQAHKAIAARLCSIGRWPNFDTGRVGRSDRRVRGRRDCLKTTKAADQGHAKANFRVQKRPSTPGHGAAPSLPQRCRVSVVGLVQRSQQPLVHFPDEAQ